MTDGTISAYAKTDFASGTHKGITRSSTTSIRSAANLCAAVPFTNPRTMASSKTDSKSEPKTKKFGKGERTIPHSSQKAKKFYPAEDEAKPRKVSRLSAISRSYHCRNITSSQILAAFDYFVPNPLLSRSANPSAPLAPARHSNQVASSSSSLVASEASASFFSNTSLKASSSSLAPSRSMASH